MVTVVILNYNTRELLNLCLKSIVSKSWKYKLSLLAVDNNSIDDSVEYIKKHYKQVDIILNDKNLGFAGGNNIALRKVKTRYILLLNSDTEVRPKSIDELIDFAQKGDFAISSCKLLNEDGSFQPNAGDLPFGFAIFSWLSGLDGFPVIGKFLPSFHRNDIIFYKNERQVGWVSGTAMLIRDDVIQKIGLLDENLFMYTEDTDYCIRAKKAGLKIGWTAKAEIIHLGGGSLKEPQYRQWLGEFEGLIYLYRKYFGEFSSMLLKIQIYFFIILRVIVFFLIGKINFSKIYAKVLFNF